MSDSSLPANLREFHCQHCNGKIRIPKDLPPTTGPCPHCHGIITSPAPEALAPVSNLPPAPSSYVDPLPQPGNPVAQIPAYQQPSAAPQTSVYEQPAPVQQPISAPAAGYQVVHMPAEPEYYDAPSATAAPQPEPVADAPPAESLPQRRGPIKPDAPIEQKKSLAPIFVLTGLLLAFAGGAVFVVSQEMKKADAPKIAPTTPQNPAMAENQYLRIGWQKDAYNVLGKFLAGKTVEEKVPYILNGDKLKKQMDSFYGGSVIHDFDTPSDAFSVHELTEEDHQHGIFMLVYDQPPQFDIKEFFRPLATLEVQYGVNEADLLLSTVARVSNFASEPLRVSAFFKRTPQGLKLDWETFAQTKYRTFQTLVEFPEAGQGGIFRLLITEDVPDGGKAALPGVKTYRISDPASPEVSARVNVNMDSPIGKILSEINWLKQENRPISRTVTLELRWSAGDQPQLQISRFICWEFLHLGGEEKR